MLRIVKASALAKANAVVTATPKWFSAHTGNTKSVKMMDVEFGLFKVALTC
jgi:hypothetical protein